MYDYGIVNGLVYHDYALNLMHLYFKDGLVAGLHDQVQPCQASYDAKGCWVLPGVIDPHVHMALNLGRFQSVDDFQSGTRSAAFGGVTTILDFLDPVHTAGAVEEALRVRLQQAKGAHVDYGFHLTVANPKDSVAQIVEKMVLHGLSSVKLFTTYSNSNRRTYEPEIIALLEASKKYNFLVMAHIEDDEQIYLDSSMTFKDLGISRPLSSETDAALKMAQLAQITGGRLYMVHLSAGQTLAALKNQYGHLLGHHLWLESCPQYFHLDESLLNQTEGYLWTLAPPLRSKASLELLKSGFASIHTIGTDHCPFNRQDKHQKSLMDMPLGIGGIEHAFSLMHALFGAKAIPAMTEMPAKLFGLYPKKGVLEIGSEADVMVFNPNAPHIIKGHHGQSDYDPYLNKAVKGQVEATFLKGQCIMANGELKAQGQGQYLAC